MQPAALRLWRARAGDWGPAAPPTCLIGGDVDHGSSAGLGAQVGHAVDRLDPEGVVHMGQQVGHQEAKESACNAGDLGSIPGSGRSPGEGNGNPLQYSYLENPMDGKA